MPDAEEKKDGARDEDARSGSGPVRGASSAARRACRRLERLTGHAVDGVCGVTREEDGWCVDIDVVEVARIPDTTSLIATYQVHVDDDGTLLGCRRVRRFRRCATDC